MRLIPSSINVDVLDGLLPLGTVHYDGGCGKAIAEEEDRVVLSVSSSTMLGSGVSVNRSC